MHTCVTVPRLKLMFDIGVGAPKLTETPRLLLTHGHLDHSAGIPYYISQRNLRHLPPAEIYVPPAMAPALNRIMELWAEIEGYQPQYSIHAIEYDRIYPLSGTLSFQALPSFHRVPSNGYAIVERTTKLREEFLGLPGAEISRLKRERDDLFYQGLTPHIVFSGDTRIEFVLEHELVRRAKILFHECTYICEKRGVDRAREWGHTHLEEIVANAEAFRDVETLVLIHFSPRYGREQIHETLRARIPAWLFEKTIAFLAPPSSARRKD